MTQILHFYLFTTYSIDANVGKRESEKQKCSTYLVDGAKQKFCRQTSKFKCYFRKNKVVLMLYFVR